jgi:serine/threonine protein kinase
MGGVPVAIPGGTRVGVHEIVSRLGVGGMGEVYRARDTRLDRYVAIKILHESFAQDPDRLARFEREAKLLASLNHPHIAQIYGLEDSEQGRALVMELVDGPTLADRIAQGALPLEEALAIARQIAEALEAAHDQGIIHRDLKPANIKLRQDGAVKVLDFGLAKLADPMHGASDAAALTSPVMTQAGLVAGTPAYMSPEQARGQTVDARADLWAYGCVCYEMLTGRRAFDGETASDAISAVLTRDPDWTALPQWTPGPVRRLLRRCLARDVSRRLRHAGDVRLELEEIASSQPSDVAAPSQGKRTGIAPAFAWTIALVSSVAALGLGWRTWSVKEAGATVAPRTTRLELSLPSSIELFPSTSSTVVASPEGQSVAFVGTSGGNRQLFLRRLDAFDWAPVRGTLGATTATFFADGQSMAFVTSGGELKTSSLTDGLVTTVAKDVSLLYGFTGAADDQIIFTRAGTLWTVARNGGAPRQLTTLANNEQTHGWSSALPDGRTVIFTVETAAGPHVEALTLASGERRVVLKEAARAKVGPEGRLFFYRDNRMLAARFDASTLSVTGTPILVMDKVPDLGGGVPVGDVSPAGLLVFPLDSPQRRLVWVSRKGVEEPVSDTLRSYLNPRLSPDGTRIVVQAGAIWVHDLRRNVVERVVTPSTPANAFPIWLPDGTTILHRSGTGLRLQSTDSGGQGSPVLGTTEFDHPGAVTTDGRTLVFLRSSPETSFDTLVTSFEDPGRVRPLVKTVAYEGGARLSADDRWLVYVSNESGRNEVYVRSFPEAERRRQVSNDGGSQPAWNPNSREIFYRIGDRMMSVNFTAVGNDLQLSAPRQLFARAYAYGAGITIANYDVSKDGQRFLMVRDETTVGRLRVILNWHADTPAAR